MNSEAQGRRIVFRNARIFDGDSAALIEGADVVVCGNTIEEVTAAPFPCGDSVELIDCGGRVLMPGLIDAHVHVYAAGLNLTRLAQLPVSYLAHFAAQFLHACLDRGFTTVRDVGGADVGLASAIRDGLLTEVPRLIYGGRVITQTGGHGDFRPGDHALDGAMCCGCGFHSDAMAVVADGVDAVRRAVREELRRGALHIKIMASGGVASPTDPLDRCQYSDEEIRAAVDEAERAGKYVAAHCHPAEAVRRAAALGIRSIEHCTLVDRETADFVAERGAFAVPTMATIVALAEEGKELGLPPASVEKLKGLRDAAFRSLEILKAAGVKMALGTDLLGAQHVRQSTEFGLRAQVLPAIDVLRSACAVNAELVGQSGTLGCIRKGAAADLVLVDGNPLEDISLLDRGGERLAVIVQAGRFHKRAIPATA
ncbi:MAG TPA: amidohydrolase family protein [Terracidiphilus sp.]|jgi:imidazolonepropionase-like amidohydrolase|nr:amidohydrolase family protein [Terracidiphilus sp.]